MAEVEPSGGGVPKMAAEAEEKIALAAAEADVTARPLALREDELCTAAAAAGISSRENTISSVDALT